MARYRKHIITRDDTIQSISQQQTGSVHNWNMLVEFNELLYPYIVYSQEEKLENPEHLKTIGDTIIIPLEQGLLEMDIGTLNENDRNQVMNLVLGSDLSGLQGSKEYQHHGSRDELFELGGGVKGDIQIARGPENLKQATIARLLTRRGSLLLHPEYGSELHLLIGEKSTSLTLELIDNEILQTIQKDGRVESANRISSTISNELYQGEFEVWVAPIEEMFRIVIEGEEDGGFTIM